MPQVPHLADENISLCPTSLICQLHIAISINKRHQDCYKFHPPGFRLDTKYSPCNHPIMKPSENLYLNISRRSLLLSLLLSGCTGKRYSVSREYQTVSEPEYIMSVHQENDCCHFIGQMQQRVTLTTTNTTQTFEKQYKLTPGIIRNEFDHDSAQHNFVIDPLYPLKKILSGEIPFIERGHDKYVGEDTQYRYTNTITTPARYRDVVISIFPLNVLHVAKTDECGCFRYNLWNTINKTEPSLYAKDYTILFYNDTLSKPIIFNIPRQSTEPLFAARRNRIEREATYNTKNFIAQTTSDFRKNAPFISKEFVNNVKQAYNVYDGAKTARDLYKLYKKYGRTFALIRQISRYFAIEFPVGTLISEAFFYFLDKLCEDNDSN